MKATVTERGQISIPARIRREMRLEPGQIVIFERVSEHECRLLVQSRKKIRPNPLAAIGFAKRHGLPTMRTAEWMSALREGEQS